MPASRILRFVRTSRCVIAGSATRNALASSAVVSPSSVRRVSATRPSNGSAGWQQVKISRSRSSGTPESSPDSAPGCGSGSSPTAIAATSRSLVASVAVRRSRFTARLRAVVVSQAPGRRGTPSRGHVSSARRSEEHTSELQSRRDLVDRKSTRLNSSHVEISYAVFCLKKKKKKKKIRYQDKKKKNNKYTKKNKKTK